MGKKLLTLIGIGAGVVLVRKEMKNNPTGITAKTVSTIAENPKVQQAAAATKNKAAQVMQEQGEKVTDKLADLVKERLFGVRPENPEPPVEYVEIQVEEIDPKSE